MIKADFHIHSTLSDGSDTVAEIVQKALRLGLSAIAITDHDTLAQHRQIQHDPRIQVLCGIEISAIDPETGVKAHVLGYHIDDIGMVESVVAPIRERRHQNSLLQIGLLKDHGYYIDLDRLKKADGKYIYKQHIMEYLVKTGQVEDMFGSFYHRVFKHGGYCDFDIPYLDVRDAVSVLHRAGGKAVLAHPGQQQNFYLIEAMPFDGIEYNHMENKPEDKETIMECVRDSATTLFLTGGSDFHGSYGDMPVAIGEYLACESGVQSLC